LFISHDLPVINISDRAGVMYFGGFVELCSAGQLFTRPGHSCTAALLDANSTPAAIMPSIFASSYTGARKSCARLFDDLPSYIQP